MYIYIHIYIRTHVYPFEAAYVYIMQLLDVRRVQEHAGAGLAVSAAAAHPGGGGLLCIIL